MGGEKHGIDRVADKSMMKYDTLKNPMPPRSKIAITLKDDILQKLDRAVDGKIIRNRSHAIEYFLQKAFATKAQKALIIANHNDFSSLTPFEGKAVVEYQMELLKKYGVQQIMFLLHKKEGAVRDALGDGSKYGLQFTYQLQDGDDIGTAHAVSLAKEFVKDEIFFVMYSHVIADLDLSDFATHHGEANALATIALTSIEDPSRYGAVKIRGERIVGFEEKPKEKEGVSRVISAGIFCLSPEIFNYIPKGKSASIEKDVFPRLIREEKIAGYMFEGKWCNVRNLMSFSRKRSG